MSNEVDFGFDVDLFDRKEKYKNIFFKISRIDYVCNYLINRQYLNEGINNDSVITNYYDVYLSLKEFITNKDEHILNCEFYFYNLVGSFLIAVDLMIDFLKDKFKVEKHLYLLDKTEVLVKDVYDLMLDKKDC